MTAALVLANDDHKPICPHGSFPVHRKIRQKAEVVGWEDVRRFHRQDLMIAHAPF